MNTINDFRNNRIAQGKIIIVGNKRGKLGRVGDGSILRTIRNTITWVGGLILVTSVIMCVIISATH